MKKIFLFILAVAVGATSWAQQPVKTKPAAKPSKPVTPSTTLKTVNDSASYAIGVSVASFYKQQGITNINTIILSRAIGDVMSGKKALLDDMTCNTVVTKLINTAQEKNPNITIEEVKNNLEMRDYIDSHREVSPLRKADDAIVLDNTNLTPEQQFQKALAWAKERKAFK